MAQQTASVSIGGTPENPIFNFVLPTGAKGEAGGWNAGVNLGTLDLDTVTTPGLYYQASTALAMSTANHYPPMNDMAGSARGVLEVESWSGGAAVIQRFTRIGSGGNATGGIQRPRVTYVRYREGVWSEWSVLANARVDNTAGRVVYLWDEQANREQMVYGDTGWRNLPLINGFNRTLQVRREGGIVTLLGNVRRPPGGSINGEFAVIPPDLVGTGSWIYHPVRSNANPSVGALYRKNDLLSFTDLSETNVVDVTEVRFEIQWSTTKPWPATLPGTSL